MLFDHVISFSHLFKIVVEEFLEDIMYFLCGGISQSIWSCSSASPARFSNVFSSDLLLASSLHLHQ